MKLIVNESKWSGFSEDNPNYNDIIVHEYDLKLNEKYIVKSRKVNYIVKDEIMGKNKNIEKEDDLLTFVIKNITNDGIVIETTKPFSDEKDGINLNTNKREFIISKENGLCLDTPWMDCGYSFTFKIIE